MLIQNLSLSDTKVILDLLVRRNQTPNYEAALVFTNDTLTYSASVANVSPNSCLILDFYQPQGKVMFLHLSVCSRWGRGVCRRLLGRPLSSQTTL